MPVDGVEEAAGSARHIPVQVFDGRALIFSQRCPLASGARFLAAGLKGDHRRNGWSDAAAADRLDAL
jgi:hypothetical protein